MNQLRLRPLLNNLTIKTSNLEYRKLDLDYVDPDPTIGDWGWAQRPYIAEIERQYNAGQPVRVMVLKARQLGISTATEAVLFLWAFRHPGTNGAVISHKDGQAQELFNMTKRYWDTWPHKVMFKEQYKTRRQLQWVETGSNLRVVTAKTADALRGSTIHALHASEVGFWDDAETLWGGLEPSIPNRHGTFVCLESTANGIGNWFYEEWQRAEVGDSAFTPLFFPWYRHSATRIYGTTLSTVELDAEEKYLYSMMLKGQISSEYALASLAFRRVEIRKKGEDWFHQEYPTTAEEAFVTSGNPIFNPKAVRDCYDQKTGVTGRLFKTGSVGMGGVKIDGNRIISNGIGFDPDPSGPFTLYKKPHYEHNPNRYFIGGDPARSNTMTADPSCIQVIHRSTLEQVAVWHGQIDPVAFAREMMLAGDFFGHAMLCPEVEGGGMATIGALQASGYGNIWAWKKPDRTTQASNTLGWLTSYGTKRWAIGELQELINTRSLIVHDKRTFYELLNFVEHENGTLGNEGRSGHDDTVMALAIAIAASKREGFFNPRQRQQFAPDIFTSELEADVIDINSAQRRYNERTLA